jgi:hypothetical protein
MESGTNPKFYEPVSQIACICDSFYFVLNLHIPLYLDSKEKPFFRTFKAHNLNNFLGRIGVGFEV